MSIDVIMPQMGESIAEGTLTKWLKNVGEHVKRDEPLFEISTDKVDAEIPSPAEGILIEILVQEGETVPINTVVAKLGTKAELPKGVTAAEPALEAPRAKAGKAEAAPSKTDADTIPAAESKLSPEPSAPLDTTRDARRKAKSSPLVRKIAKEHGIDIAHITGTGEGGRVTKKDILHYIDSGPKPAPPPSASVPVDAPPVITPPGPAEFPEEDRVVRESMSVMRKKIAEHMVRSRRTSAHVTTVFEVDMSHVVRNREAMKEEFEREGVKLTFLPFIIEAVVKGLKAYPILNASIEEDTVIYKKDINIGIAVALDWGLIVPVIKHADELNLLGLAKTTNDLAERARKKKLNPEDVQGGTFSITNPGVFGSLFGTPIISQPQVAILDIGAVQKRPVVINDAIAIRPMVYISISFDHRLIDGAVADQFMAFIKKELETP